MRKQLIVAAALALAAAGTFAQQAPASAPLGASNAHSPVGVAPHSGEVRVLGVDGHTPRIVSREQFLKESAMHFDAMDANHDGVLTPEERRAFFEAHRAELEHRPPVQASGAAIAPHSPASAPVAAH
ncbi:TPA: hypothetical protein QDB04_000510 [Burkholderia vietnamiensis]|nr:hypothetical protein [Burkholderia vietnamiensis]